MIEPSVDWYGSYARRSAVADYLELLALSNESLSVDDLADRIRDNRWTESLGERIGAPMPPDTREEPTLGTEIDGALERADDVLAVLRERIYATDGLYPFAMDASGRLDYLGSAPRDDPYVRLLAITVAHATQMAFKPPPFEVFEVMVVSALESAGFRTVGVGVLARGGRTFHEVLTESCESVGLKVYPERALARTFAHDEGSDVLTNVWTRDLRPGGLQLIGQATCARSNDWDAKMDEPAPLQWRNWLGGMRSPTIYLAVPHHVEDVTRAWLMEKRDRDVFDRLRLCGLLREDRIDGETAIVDAVLAQDLLT